LRPKTIYRRSRSRYTFHYREDCKKYPTENYIEEKLIGDMMPLMVCHLCKKLDVKEKAEI
jgi:hypothetical protein